MKPMSYDQDVGGPDLADTAAPLDALLVDAALGPVRRFAPDLSTAKLAASLARRPLATAQRLGSLAAEAARITIGTSSVTPDRRDRRFADEAWSQNPALRRLVQAYLAGARTAEQVVADADLGWRDRQRMQFLTENLVAACSPSNLPLVNPASAKAAIDSGGLSLARGGLQLARDLASAPRVPEMVDRSAFAVGGNLAVTPGAVVLRTEVLDLAPDRSLVEFLVREGQSVFVMSWRNPDARHAQWGFDAYVQAILDALDAVERVSRTDRTVLAGVCSGGILAALAAAHLAATGRQVRLAALVLAVTVIDNEQAGLVSALSSSRLAQVAKATSRRRGYLDGRALAEVFAWLRPEDLVWNYWVNNYLLGRKPPAFDVLFWNADTTRMAASLHADFVDLAVENSLFTPGAISVLGTPIDLSAVDVDSYLVAGVADHITPWQNCYRTTQLLGGSSRFVLSTGGHIAALVNPPGNPKTGFQLNDATPTDPAAWLAGADTQAGTWWNDASAWLAQRCGTTRPAPRRLGGGSLRPIVEAPGTYVFDH